MQNKLRHWKYLHAELIRLILCFFLYHEFYTTTYLISNHILSGKDIEITSKKISLCFVNLQLITKYYLYGIIAKKDNNYIHPYNWYVY